MHSQNLKVIYRFISKLKNLIFFYFACIIFNQILLSLLIIAFIITQNQNKLTFFAKNNFVKKMFNYFFELFPILTRALFTKQ